MTKARDWPNNARHARDRAAEETNAALAQSERLYNRVRRGEFTRNGLELDLLEINKRLTTAMRHLEKVGAETEPE